MITWLILLACHSGTVAVVGADTGKIAAQTGDTDTDSDTDTDTDSDTDTDTDVPADADGDGYAADVDCDDTDPDVHPDAVEVCDGKDNDCNGQVDDADAGVTGAPSWYRDLDGDGFGDPDHALAACVAPSGYVDDDTDCDDFAPRTYPEADETCDDVDDDCDGTVDENPIDGNSYFADVDKDGYGDPLALTSTCAIKPPAGYVDDDTDCYDKSATANPAATGWFDSDRGDGSFDYDCDGSEVEQYPDLAVCTYYSTSGGGWYPSVGWVPTGKIPSCGDSANFYYGDVPALYNPESACTKLIDSDYELKTQLCH